MRELDMEQINHIDIIVKCISDHQLRVISDYALEKHEEIAQLDLATPDVNFYLELLESEFGVIKELMSDHGSIYEPIPIKLKKFVASGGALELAKHQKKESDKQDEFEEMNKKISELTLWKLELEKKRSWTYYFSRIAAILSAGLVALKIIELLIGQ